jgi:hypothetical protein
MGQVRCIKPPDRVSSNGKKLSIGNSLWGPVS